jgi:Ca-activated chloride channel family protein
MSEWYFARQGQTFGPFSDRELRDLARSGKLLPEDLISQPGAKKWHPASAIRGLFSGSSDEFGSDDPPQAVRVVPPQAQPMAAEPILVASSAPAGHGAVVAARPGRLPPILLALPKPILFGLFGGLGGLLGAVLLAELIWLVLKPAAAAGVLVAVPDVVRTYVGGKNTFLVKVARQRFKGPLKVETTGTGDITVPVATIAAESDEAKVEVQTPAGTSLGNVPLEVRVSAPENKTIEPVKAKLTLSVEPLPPTVAVVASRQVTVEKGGRGRFTVRIARDRFNDHVALQFQGVPDGITLPPTVVIPADKNDTTVDLTADADAPLARAPVTVQAIADVGGQKVAGDTKFDLVVKERSPPAVDVLFVLDLTDSMQFAINGIKQGIQSFTEQLVEKKLDARFGVICFRDIQDDGERPFALNFGGSTFTRDYRELRDKVAPLKAGGGGDIPESSLQGLALAVRQPFRSNATRALILITDAAPKIHPDEKPSTIPETIDELKKHEIDQVHLVVRREDLNSHWKAFQPPEFKGSFFDILKSRGGNAFADLLPVLSRDISRITVSTPPKAASKASEPPPLPEARSSAPPPETAVPTLKAVQSDQAFAAADRGRLLVATMVWTMLVAGAISLLLLAGQQFHARQSWVHLGEGAWAVLGGVVAGLIGGGVGQLVFQSTSGASSWEWASRILGWSFLGSLIGVLLAFFVPNLKWYRGMLGGLAGGIFGAVAFLLVTLIMGSLLGRWLGAAILGFCLGVMVALAELAFRRFWLEIAVSPREVRTMTLGSTAISLGSDERRASFFVAGAPPVALRYWVEGNDVYCEDVPTGETTIVAPGENRKIGRVAVTMRSVSASRRTGYELALIGGETLQLQEGMPLTPEDLPGLEPKGTDGMVALVSAQPNRPQEVLLRNRSKQTWTAWDASGRKQPIEPGRGVELATGVEVDFGQVAGIIQRAEEKQRVRR